MNTELSNIKCPDCNLEYLSLTQLKHNGICNSCTRRKSWARLKSIPYIKVIDRNPAEIQKIINEKNNKGKQKTKTRTKNERKEIINKTIKLANSSMTIEELYNKLKTDYFSNLEDYYSKESFKNLVYRNRLSHKRIFSKFQRQSNNYREIEGGLENKEIKVEPFHKINDLPTSLDTKDLQFISEQLTKSRFEDIIKEITNNLTQSYKENNCWIDNNINFESYVFLITIIRDLVYNIDKYSKYKEKQMTILNNYQLDMVHEIENVVTEDGDTSLQDKLHILRKIRRQCSIEITALQKLKPLISVLQTRLADIGNIHKKLSDLQNTLYDVKYIPRVDVNLCNKYLWAISTTENSDNSKNLERIKKTRFRASCYLSGDKFRNF